MSKRQKRKDKFIATNNYLEMLSSGMKCSYCEWESRDSNIDEIKTLLGEDYKNNYSGHALTMMLRCPICNTILKYSNSDIKTQ